MADIFDGDIALFSNLTHGEIQVKDGQTTMDQGLESSVFISLYSGKPREYWGNNLNIDPDFNLGGEYESLAEGLNATPANAQTLIQAILNDLNWMKSKGIATKISVDAEIIGAKTINFTISIQRPFNLDEENIRFSTNWEGQFNRPAHLGLI